MQSLGNATVSTNEILFFVLTVVAAMLVSLSILLVAFICFRREQRRWQKKVIRAIVYPGQTPEELFLTGHDAISCGELIAQFKVNRGKQVVSVLESDGKRFIHVVGELTPVERTKMLRYLKSEGFMS
jgi:phage terminase large subunit-like protein